MRLKSNGHICLLLFFTVLSSVLASFRDLNNAAVKRISWQRTPPPPMSFNFKYTPINESSGAVPSSTAYPFDTFWPSFPTQTPSDPLSLFNTENVAKPTVPSFLRNYFALDTSAGELIRSLVGPKILPPPAFTVQDAEHFPMFQTTTMQSWTRATTPKDKLVDLMEKSLDAILSGNYKPFGGAKKRVSPELPNYLEEEQMLQHSKDIMQSQMDAEPEEMEGSGSDGDVGQASASKAKTKQQQKQPSSIRGIPKIMPHMPKVPTDFVVNENKQMIDSLMSIPKFIAVRPDVPQGGFGPILANPQSNIRRHPGYSQPKAEKEFQYGSKPSYKQGLVSSVLDFMGLQNTPLMGQESSELDKTLTDWILEHSPTTTTRAQRRMKVDSGYNVIQKFISQSVMPLCTPQPEVVQRFNVEAFMGQWFQVMHSPLMSTTSCSMMSYKMLTESNSPNGIGSIFQTLEYSTPKVDDINKDLTEGHVQLTSGYAVVTRTGQIIYHKSNSPEDIIVHVIHVDEENAQGQYDYAILAINCNYPLFVIPRDPAVFKQQHEQKVNQILRRKGLINDVSRFLNILSPVDFAYCMLPPTIFDS